MSWVIFNNPDYFPDWLVSKLAKEVFTYQDNDKWFWKLGKKGYKDMLIQLIAEDRAMQIEKYGGKGISAFLVEWTSFYQDPSSYLEYIILDAFYATKILTSRVT